ncbi:MAG: phage terminase small subunit-related protein [Defluviitaleaceae bacterium]|nr:phage terminase small subunit-related protein [Defluviitaleaceae bacterium]
MPRPRSEWSIEAERRYHAGEKLTDIAKAMGKPEGTVRRCKAEQGWGVKKKVTERSETITERSEIPQGKRATTRKPIKNNPTTNASENDGAAAASRPSVSAVPKTNTQHPKARPGNKNAVGNSGGNGGPPGNKKAVTTGEYETLRYGDLTDEERALLYEPLDIVGEMEQTLLFERVRIRRMNQRVMAAETAPSGMVVDNVIKVQGLGVGKMPVGTQTTADAGVNRADRFDNSLTRVLTGVRKGMAELHKMKSTNADSELVDDWLGGFADDEA